MNCPTCGAKVTMGEKEVSALDLAADSLREFRDFLELLTSYGISTKGELRQALDLWLTRQVKS